jgi:hypothetical protein
MDHILKSRLVVAMVAAIAASAVMLATTTATPPKLTTELASLRISTQVVELVASPEALTPTSRSPAAASPEQIISAIFQATIGRVAAGAGAGFLVGFLGGGAAALGAFGRIPVIGTPIVQAIAITAGIVGIPIGAVVGAVSAVVSLASSLGSMLAPPASVSATAARKAAVTQPHRSTNSSTRPNRHAAKPSAKTSAPQQSSNQPQAGSGRGHAAASNRAERH